MTKIVRNLVALTLAGAMLTACSTTVPLASSVAGTATLEAQAASSKKLAQTFAGKLRPHGAGQLVTTEGAVVTLTSDAAGAITYDFSATPKTRLVKVSAGEASTEVPHAQLIESVSSNPNTQALPVMVVPIAMSVVTAGAKAYIVYKLKHPGEQFNKHDAIQIVVSAMGVALVQWAPGGKYLSWLVPLVVEALMEKDLNDYKAVFKALVAKLDVLVEAIKHIIHKDAPPETELAF
jgi:hypothetical protein